MLTQERATPSRPGVGRAFPLAAGALIYAGALAVLDGGYLVPASTKTGLIGVGRMRATVSNVGGANGAVVGEVDRGVFRFDNSTTDPITLADLEASAYAVDDATVARTSGTGTRSSIGKIHDVDADGVWVRF